jgi:hypothetical protein
MSNGSKTMQFVVDNKTKMDNSTGVSRAAFFDEDGNALEVGAEIPESPQAEAVPDSTATDVAGLVDDHNALLASLRAAGLLAS